MQAIDLVHRSTTRRKACAGCVKAKRRCDLTIPTCSRCCAKKLACSYTDRTAAFAAGKGLESHTEHSLDERSPPLVLDSSLKLGSQILPLMNARMGQRIFIPSPYESFQFPELAIIEPHQIDYCIFELRRAVVSLALEGRASFIHPDLYHDTMPEMYQDMLSICSLYNQKTEDNSIIVFRMLFIKLQKLIHESRSITRVEDRLLSVQALIMYLIIRVFDEDTKLQANAAYDFQLLENWTTLLQQGYAESADQSWILMESIRRTLMMSVLFRCLFKILKNGMSELVPLMSALPVSKNTTKWESRSSEDSDTLVTYRNFVNDWNQGMVTKVDDYEMLLLKACRHAITIA